MLVYSLEGALWDCYGNSIGIYYGSSIALVIHSLDPSLFVQLIGHYPFP